MSNTAPKQFRRRMHEHRGSMQELLALIERDLNASSIMTPWPSVDCVTSEGNSKHAKASAKQLMDDFQYSGVPVVWQDEVVGIFTRHNPGDGVRFEKSKPDLFVSGDIALIDLIRHMRDNDRIVLGIGTPSTPEGWLSYADFSKRPFRVLLFAIVAEVEYLLASAVDQAFPNDEWAKLLAESPEFNRASLGELLVRQVEAKHWDVTMPLTTFAEIGHLASVASVAGKVQEALGEAEKPGEKLKSLSELRNRVAHVVRPIIAGPKQITSVANQLDMMLGWINKWPARLNAPESLDNPE